ncbi:MAG: heavy metal-binding domain-containing protein [Desulfobacterales bacterium]
MAEKKYDLIFEGKVAEGQNRSTVAKNLMNLLKTDQSGVKRLFSGEPAVIKKGMDRETAMKYKQAVNKAGALCRIEETGAPPAPLPQKEKKQAPVQKSAVADKAIKQKQVPEKAAKPEPPKETADEDKPEMILCPHCNYRQKTSAKCIMCGKPITEIIEAAPQIQPVRTRPIQRLPKTGEVLLTNIESVPGREIVEHFGLVSGNTIRAKHVGKDIMASLKNLIGGELKGYTQLLQESRAQAVDRMREQARQLGANAVVNVRFSTSSVTQGAAELYAYGTAVRIE